MTQIELIGDGRLTEDDARCDAAVACGSPMVDLLLINAPSRQRVYGPLTEFSAIEPPVWAGLIATAVINAGFTAQILDAEAEGMTVAQAATEVIFRQPRLVAFSVYGQQPSASTQCLPAASATVRAMREQGVDILPTLAFGTHPSALPERTLREEPFDYAVEGEGLRAIVALLKGSTFPAWPRHLSNPNILDLDAQLPRQAWELLDMKRYRAHNWHLWTGDPAGGYASVQTSLGCPFRCSFCCINAPFGGSSIRYWSVGNVCAQIEGLVKDRGITNIKIPDEMFTLNPQRVKEICQRLIDLGLGERLNMWAYARIDTVKDTEMLALMRAAGFRWLGLGIESGSKHVRDGVEKGRFDGEDILRAVGRVHLAGIAVGANYIFGLPDDTRDSMQETLDLACALNTEWANFYCAMAYPGSALHAQVSKTNPSALPENNPCGWIGYSQHAPETLPLPTETLTAAQVLAFRDEAFMAYFSRPEYTSMLTDRFGPTAAQSVSRMLSFGKPYRNLLRGEG